MDEVTLHAFSGLDGRHVRRLAYSALSWSDSINQAGTMSATVACDGTDLSGALRPYGTVLAATCAGRVLHAGYVTKVTPDPESQTVAVSAGGGLTILEKRLVLNRALITEWRDGTVLIDEENPPGAWVLELRGTYRDIVRGLLAETMAWGALPISLPPVDGGSAHERTYNCWDLATVYDRVSDIGDLEDGPEIRLDPSVSGGALTFALRVEDEIVDHRWRWSLTAPGQGIGAGRADLDGALMCTQSFGTAGKNDDTLLVAHATGGSLESMGWPVLQVANTSHTTISVLATLQSYVRADVAAGDSPQETASVTVPLDLDVRVGDWADVRVPSDGWHAAGSYPYKVTDVSADAATGRQTVSMRPRVR